MGPLGRVVVIVILACVLQQNSLLPALAIRLHRQAKSKPIEALQGGAVLSSTFFGRPAERVFGTSTRPKREQVKEDIPMTSSDKTDMPTWWGAIADTYPPPFLGPAIAVDPDFIDHHEGSLSLDLQNSMDSDLLEGIDVNGDSQVIAANSLDHDKSMEP
ncbi:hypothetical protein L7F22_040549 [Adiantum nelumboides]|nr:hypothetical protein [Adiantum nelumboides]